MGELAESGAPAATSPASPTVSIVVASEIDQTQVETTLDILSKLEFDLGRVEIVLAFFGSVVEATPTIEADAREGFARLVTVEGVRRSRVEARNAALDLAQGEWLTFVDGGDSLSESTLRDVAEAIASAPDVMAVLIPRRSLAANGGSSPLADPLNGRLHRSHAGRLAASPELFPYTVTGTVIRWAADSARTPRFDERIASIFEEAHFLARCLQLSADPKITVAKPARYVELINAHHEMRHRRDHVTTARYTDSWRWGVRDLVERFASPDGLPVWLQTLVLYELHWLFRTETRTGLGVVARDSVAEEFREHLNVVLPHLAPYVIDGYRVSLFARAWRDTLLHGLGGPNWHTPYVVVTSTDRPRQMIRISYRFVGSEPSFAWHFEGEPTDSAATKIQAHNYFGFGPILERHHWITTQGSSAFFIDGEGVPVERAWKIARKYALNTREIRQIAGYRPASKRRGLVERYVPTISKLRHHVPLLIARAPVLRRVLKNPWILMDREDQGEDSAEVLFRYLRAEHPDVNAWFVVRRGTPTWRRLRAEGHRRVVPYGSLAWRVLMLKAEFLISVQANPAVTAPPELRRYRGRIRARFVFLQHGVIKDDASRWLNNKQMAMMLTSTRPEHESIVGDKTRYTFTDWEIKLTGLPRFDALTQAEENSLEAKKRSAIVIAPTWRKWLDDVAGDVSAFARTEYAREWLAFINSPLLFEAARRHGKTIAVLPHPNLRDALQALDLPSYVELWDFEDGRAQQNFVEAAVLVTDYSSMAFNAAYLDRRVVYFQFDRERHDAGDHTALPGYFDYDDDGFGPRVEDVTSALERTVAAIDGDAGDEVYARRRAATFPYRDGRASERVVQQIFNLRTPWLPKGHQSEP